MEVRGHDFIIFLAQERKYVQIFLFPTKKNVV